MSFKENVPLACEVSKQRLATFSVLDDSVFRVRDGGERRGPAGRGQVEPPCGVLSSQPPAGPSRFSALFQLFPHVLHRTPSILRAVSPIFLHVIFLSPLGDKWFLRM